MTRAKEKAERKAKAITAKAGRALRVDNETEFHQLFPECDVSLKFTYKRISEGEEVECDLFSCACYGIANRQKDDLAKLIVKRMIAEGVDLRVHRTNKFGFTTLMMAASYCNRALVEIVLPLSDTTATTSDGLTAVQLARGSGLADNASYIEAFILGKDEAKKIGDDIPIPIPIGGRRRSIDDR